MTDKNALNEIIKESGVSKIFVARRLGITDTALRLKINGEREFKQSEIAKLQELFRLTNEQTASIFFAKEVALQSTEEGRADGNIRKAHHETFGAEGHGILGGVPDAGVLFPQSKGGMESIQQAKLSDPL